MSWIRTGFLMSCLLGALLPAQVLANDPPPSAAELDCRAAAGFNDRGVWLKDPTPAAIASCEAASRAPGSSADTLAYLGRAYYFAERHEDARRVIEAAQQRGSVLAVVLLGVMHENGYAFARDPKEAVRLYRIAAEQGQPNAQYNLGVASRDGNGAEKDDAQAVLWHRRAGDQGYAMAQSNLGWMYESGRGVEKDDTQAVLWYRKAAEQGNANAQYNLGVMYGSGRGVEKDDTQAVLWYRKAAEQGNASAQINLGWRYANGQGVAKNDAQAVQWYRKAAEQGNVGEVQTTLGRMYADGQHVEKDDTEAVLWYRKAAEQGSASGQSHLGYMYAVGRGVPKDDAQAILWYRKAAEQGDASAQAQVGVMYANGQGVSRDDAQAVLWYRKAAEQSHAVAQSQLGVRYATGRGVSKDDAQAVSWYRKAAEQGDAAAQYNLAVAYTNGAGVSQDEGQAVTWYRKAADQGLAEAQYRLALAYDEGDGVKKDEAQAVVWYRKAADQGHADAQYNLAVAYDEGLGVKKDQAEAKRWYEKAAAQGDSSALSALADGLLRDGDLGSARNLYQQALDAAQREHGPEHVDVADRLQDLAGALWAAGNYGEALPLAQRAFKMREKLLGREHPDTMDSALGVAYQRLMLGDSAAESALPASTGIPGASIETGETDQRSVFLGAVTRVMKGQYQEAISILQRGLQRVEKEEEPRAFDTVWYLMLLAWTHQITGDNEGAHAFLERARSNALNASDDSRWLALLMVDVALAEFHLSEGRLDLAESRTVEAYSLRRSDLLETSWQLPMLMAAIRAKQGRGSEAVFFGKLAVNRLQVMRAEMSRLEQSLQNSFRTTRAGPYNFVADLLIEQGRLAEAEQVLGLLKEHELFQLMGTRDKPGEAADFVGAERKPAAEVAALMEEGIRSARELDDLERRAREAALSAADEARRQALQDAQQVWRRHLQQWFSSLQPVLARSREDAARERQRLSQQTTRLQTIVGAEAGAVGLHYVVTDNRLSIIVATARGSFPTQVDIKRSVLERQIASLRSVVQNATADPLPAAQALYGTLIKPVIDALRDYGASTLVLSLTDNLRYVPFAALHDGKQYLVEQFGIAHLAWAGNLTPVRTVHRWQVAAMGMTEAVPPHFQALPAVRDELAGIVKTPETQGVLPGDIALDASFGRQRLEAALRGKYQVVHVASHFEFRPGSEGSFLLLGDKNPLTLATIGELDFTSVDLLTLSACNTAMGGGVNERGAEVEGLAARVQDKGAASVLATLWKVVDPSTAILMRNFYQSIAGAKPPTLAESLQRAQLALLNGAGSFPPPGASVTLDVARQAHRKGAPSPVTRDPGRPYAHPYFWAPFTLSGNWL